MRYWRLPGPDDEVMTAEKVANYIRVSRSTLDRMIADGRFPRGNKPSPGAEPIWMGSQVAAWMHIHALMTPEERPKKSAD